MTEPLKRFTTPSAIHHKPTYAQLESRLAAAEAREKTVAPGHAVLAKAVADAREETMQVQTKLAAAEAALSEASACQHPPDRVAGTGGDTTDVEWCSYCGALRWAFAFPDCPPIEDCEWELPEAVSRPANETTEAQT